MEEEREGGDNTLRILKPLFLAESHWRQRGGNARPQMRSRGSEWAGEGPPKVVLKRDNEECRQPTFHACDLRVLPAPARESPGCTDPTSISRCESDCVKWEAHPF